MKQIFIVENGKIEFSNQEEFERYLKGEKIELEFIRKDYYKANFNKKL
jgi:hypothetical protein